MNMNISTSRLASLIKNTYKLPWGQAMREAWKIQKKNSWGISEEGAGEAIGDELGPPPDFGKTPKKPTDGIDKGTFESIINEWFDAQGTIYLGEAGLVGCMASLLQELKEDAVDVYGGDYGKMYEDLVAAGYDQDYFDSLFKPSDESWKYRDTMTGKIKLAEWLDDVEGIGKALGILVNREAYYKQCRKFL